MVQSGYGRPPVLDRLITIDGSQVWAARRDLTVRDAVETGQVFSQVSLSYVRFIVRAGLLLTLGDDFQDDNGITRRIEGVAEIGRGQFVEILGRTASFTPVGEPDVVESPLSPSANVYRWAMRPNSGLPQSAGEYRIYVFNGTNLQVNGTDSDGKTLDGFTNGDSITLLFANGSTVAGTVTDDRGWSGFGSQSGGPAATFMPEIDVTDIGDTSVGVSVTITSGG